MWSLRILSGPQAGQVFPLKPGKNILGRGSHCQIVIQSAGASKEHCEVSVYPDRVTITDLQSRNGTIVNGIRIQSSSLKMGDKAGIHDVLFELAPIDVRPQIRPPANYGSAAPQYQSGYATDQNPQGVVFSGPEAAPLGLFAQFQNYIEEAALPGVYRLSEIAEFKWVLGGFFAVLVFVTTLLCMVPAMQIAKSSIMMESKRRVQSLARSLAKLNETALLQGSFTSVSTNSIESEDGVKKAFIIQQADGLIVSPANMQGKVPDLSFVHNARKESKAQVEVIDSSTIGASFPIGFYDPNTGDTSVKYHAIILYDVGSLAMDDGRAISLFMQSLILASLAALILFFLMYRMIEHPLTELNSQLDSALREKKDSLSVTYQYPALENLAGNINSLLSRYHHGDSSAQSHAPSSQAEEAAKVVSVIGEPCLVIRHDGIIMAANGAFEQLSRVSLSQLQGRPVTSVSDLSLQQNLEFLMNRARENSFVLHSDQLEFAGTMYGLNCQAFGQPLDYFVITMRPRGV